MSLVLGIDPGISGGVAVIDEKFNLVDCFRMPVIEIDGKKKVDAGNLFKTLSQYDISLAVLEKVGTRPGEGVVGAFSFGDSYGAARAVLECLDVPYRLERPQAWRGGQSLTGLSKEQIGEIAFEVFQADEIYRGKRLKKDGTRGCNDGISDALMIAKFGVRFFGVIMAAKSLTKDLIKRLGVALTKTPLIEIAVGGVGLPRSTFYFWKSQAQEISDTNPDRQNLSPDEELLLDFLDTIETSRAKVGQKLSDAALKGAMQDPRVAIDILQRMFPDQFAAPARREIVIKQETGSEQNTGIANIPTLGGAGGQDLEALLMQQQASAVDLAKSSTQARKPGDD